MGSVSNFLESKYKDLNLLLVSDLSVKFYMVFNQIIQNIKRSLAIVTIEV
ncbi:MAG: hypothetical protein ACK5RE_05600 [Pseudanabaena sp.]